MPLIINFSSTSNMTHFHMLQIQMKRILQIASDIRRILWKCYNSIPSVEGPCPGKQYPVHVHGEVSSPNNNVDWVSRKQFYNPTVKDWADLDNPFKRSDYAKLCMSPALDGTLPEYVISQEDNSPLTLYIDFSQFSIFLGYINSPFDQVDS